MNTPAGTSLLDQGREAVLDGSTALAVEHFTRLVETDPQEPAYRWNLGMALLANGDYDRGFEEIEHRWHVSLNGNRHDITLVDHGVPKWAGEDLTGKSVIVFHEWGLGDTIMMLRYLRIVQQRARAVTVVMPKILHGLVSNLGVRLESEVPDNAGRFDLRCPMYDFPKYLGLPSRPYLRPLKWLPGRMRGYRVGIAWSGSKTNARDSVRSIDVMQFLKMLNPTNRSDITFHSLQTTDLTEANYRCVLIHNLRDFSDTAALIARMDCVVCVDTASAHLAGALGHMNSHVVIDYACDWRWHRASDWYPTLKVHRQQSVGDWRSAFRGIEL